MRGLHRAGAVALVLPVVLSACSGDDDDGIRVAAAGRATVTEVVEAPATVAARAVATVTSAADGTVARLRVAEGDQVRAGQVLLKVESPSARRDLRRAKRADRRAAAAGASVTVPVDDAGLRAADASAAQAFRRAQRQAQAIPDRQVRRQALSALQVSRRQYATASAAARSAVDSLRAGVGSLSRAVSALSSAQRVQTRAAVDVARRTVRALTVRAPITGTVSLSAPAGEVPAGDDLLAALPESLRSQAGQALGGSAGGASSSGPVVLGAPVAAGQALATVTDTSALYLAASVDETDVLLVEPGVRAAAELDAVPDASYDSEVLSIDPVPTTSTRGGVSYVVRLSLGPGRDSTGAAVAVPRPGMSAVVDLQVRTAQDVLAVPAAAVFRDGRRDAVWVVRNGVVRKQTVRLGAQGRARIQVVEGLEVGEQIVVRGADRVRDGQRL